VAQQLDRWAEWLLRSRDGGDAQVLARRLPYLYEVRDRVLDGAAIKAGDVVLDLGTGNGLIAFGALDRTGPSGTVIFTDVSEDLLAECERIAKAAAVAAQCTFLEASADDLGAIESGTIDVATTRSVLIYLDDKRPVFDEMLRVLKPGGRISLFEPINRFGSPEPDHLFWGFDVGPVQHLAAKIRARDPPPGEHPLTNFDERDLFRYAEEAGFANVKLDYTAELAIWPVDTTDWDVLMQMSGNPLDPTMGESIRQALTAREQDEFETYLRPLVERGQPRTGRMAKAFLRATKPGDVDS
jgi:SAM-dependent methyltransferase